MLNNDLTSWRTVINASLLTSHLRLNRFAALSLQFPQFLNEDYGVQILQWWERQKPPK